jgi:hypothetical protein
LVGDLPASVSIRHHTSAWVSIRQYTCELVGDLPAKLLSVFFSLQVWFPYLGTCT